jgi:LysR family transcriptional regulator for metE and metH
MLTIKDLDLVRYVADSGSLTVAARQLHVSQSAVSQRLTNLQARLGTTLIERRDGRMQLTSAGHRVFKASKVIADELNSTMNDLNRHSQQEGGELRIATQCFTCYRWLPFVINAMREDHPSLSVDVVPEATDSPYEALRKKQIDVAIVSNPIANSEFVEQDLFSDELFAVMHASHDLANEKYLDAARFIDETLILYTGDSHAIVEDILTPANVTQYKMIQVRITEAIIELARSGQGIAVIAGWALDDIAEANELSAVRITKSGFKRNWRAVIGTDRNDEHVDSLIRRVRTVGAAIRNTSWRKKLRAEQA